MDISDEELFDATPSCSTSTTNTSLNLTEQTKNLTQNPIQEKDCNSILTKDISVKLTRLPNVKKERTNSHSFKSKKRRYTWKYGFLKGTQFYKREKKASSKSSKSQEAFRNMESTEVKSGPSENEVNEQIPTHLYNQSYKAGESYGVAQQNKQAAQKETKHFILSTCQVQEENLCTDETNVCARTLPFKFYRKNSITSNNVNAIKCSDSLLSPSNNKNTESNSHSDKSYLFDSSSPKAKKRLIHTRLKFMAKRMSKQLDEWKFKRKSVTSDSETDEQLIPKRIRRRLSSNDSDNEDATINSIEVIGNNNQNESHLSLKKIDEKETNIQISRTVRVILTRLEEMEDEEVIKWRESKTKPSDIIASEPVEEQQLDRRKLVRNLVTLESRDKLILPKEDRVLEMKDIPKDPPLITTNNCIERRYAKSKLNKLKKKYKLFKKPRVLMIKLDTLQCSSKNGRYSAIEIDCLTKKYVNFVINVNFHYKSHGLKMYRHVHLRRSTSDVNTTYSEDHNAGPSVSRTQNTNTRLKPPGFTEENSMKDVEATENNDENVPFKIHRKFARIQNRHKASSSGISEKKNNTLSPKRLEIWRNAFRTLMITEKSQKPTASMQSTSTSKTLHISRNSPKKSINAECESVITPSTPTSSTKHNTPVGSPRKLASSKKQTEASTKPSECDDTSKLESFIRHENLPNDANVEQIISRSDFTQSKDSTVSKIPRKNAKNADVTISDTSLNSSKKMSTLHEKANNLELSTNDVIPVKSKTSEVCGVEQSSHKKERAYRCHLCDASFKNDELLLKHMAMNLYKSCAVVNPTSSDASKCMEASMSNETITNKKHSQNLESSKLSTLQQQCSSVNSESSSHQLDKSVIDSDIEIPSLSSSSSSSRGSKTRREHFRIPQKKTKTRSTAKSKSDLNLDSSNREEILESKNRSINMKLKRATCKICLQVFDTQAQLLQHMFKHFANDLRNMYTSIENKLDSEHQEPNENNNQVSDDSTENSVEAAVGEAVEVAENNINEQEKNLPENTNESSAENLVASEVSQHDATKEGNEASNLSSAEFTKERDLGKQLTSVASNAEHKATKVQCAEKEKSCVAGPSLELQPMKFFTICACHRPKTNRTTGTNVQIEIVLLCTTCQTLFRRFECFESHCTPRSAEGTLCGKNRRNGRKSKLLCVSCQQMLNSVQDLWHHLVMHSRLNRTGTATFYCNICKVIFYGLGQLFYNHFQNHAKNPFFLASRLSFPRPSYIGSKLIKLPATDNDKSIEVYMQVADYVCNECRTPFITAQNLKSHKTVCQNATNTVDPRSGSSDGRGMASITSSRAPILLVCGFCNKTFYSRTSFEVHSLEHTQKRDMHIHYTCVAVTALTRVYICKVCTTMWQSLQSFEEHWLTHGVLQEKYICSRCQNHYNSIDLFQKHTITTHNDSEIQQLPITCEVIYRDISDQSSKTNPQRSTVDDLPYMDLSCFDGGKDDAEKIANDEPCESQELTDLPQNSLEKLLFGNRSTQVEAMISPELSECSNKEVQATKNVPQVPVQIPSSNAAVAQSKRSSNSNSGNINDDSDEEEELTIVLSESEESSVSNGVRKNADGTSSTKHQNAQEKTKSTTSEPAVTDGQMQCSNDAVSVDASAKTLNDVSESASSNARISVITPRESVNTQLSTNANISKNKTLACSTSVSSTTETQIGHANKTLENSVDQSVSSDTNSSREEPKESLPKNVMSAVPKSFLRVKSLAELTNTPPSENQFCGVCGLSFESRHKLRGHMAKHNRQGKQSGQASLSDNVPVWPAKPTFNLLAHIPTTSTQDRLLSPLVPINNVSPSVSARPHPPTRVIDTTNSRQYQVVGVKPLPSVKSSTITDASKPKEPLPHEVTSVPSLNNVTSTIYRQNIPQKTAYHQNLPPHISHPLNKSAQFAQQQQSTGTVAIRPFLQTTYPRPSPLSYSQQQPQQLQQQSQLQQQQPQQLQQQPSQLHQQPQQQQHQPQLQQLLQQQHPQSQQQQQQPQPLRQQPQQLQQQQQPQQLQQLQQQQPQQLQQQLRQRQQSQQLQQQLQLQLQLQQQMQQQQQINVGNNVVHYLISKTGMSYQMTSNNIIPANADNVMVVAVNTMQQVSKDPERYMCLYCPGFECGSVQEFALHEHSPKHEARSHYNGVAYVPQT